MSAKERAIEWRRGRSGRSLGETYTGRRDIGEWVSSHGGKQMNTSGKLAASTNHELTRAYGDESPGASIAHRRRKRYHANASHYALAELQRQTRLSRVPLLRASKADRAAPSSPLKTTRANPAGPGSPTKSFKGGPGRARFPFEDDKGKPGRAGFPY